MSNLTHILSLSSTTKNGTVDIATSQASDAGLLRRALSAAVLKINFSENTITRFIRCLKYGYVLSSVILSRCPSLSDSIRRGVGKDRGQLPSNVTHHSRQSKIRYRILKANIQSKAIYGVR